MSEYLEQETKIIDVDVSDLELRLSEFGVKKVFDADRVFTYFDYKDGSLRQRGEEVRLTEEDKLKLSFSGERDGLGKETIKVVVSRKKETVDFLSRLGLHPAAEIKSHRISYELGTIDFDIDVFPEIPAFLEIDLGDDPQKSLEELLSLLELKSKEVIVSSTQQIYTKFGIDIFERFKPTN